MLLLFWFNAQVAACNSKQRAGCFAGNQCVSYAECARAAPRIGSRLHLMVCLGVSG